MKKKLFAAGISKIEIERAAQKISVNIFTGKPGIVIGKGGTGVELLKKDLAKLTGAAVAVNIIEVKRVDVDAQLVAENVAQQLEKAYLVPPGDEAVYRQDDESGRQGNQDHVFRASRRRGDRAGRAVS